MSNAIAQHHQAGPFKPGELDSSRIVAAAGAIAVNAVVAMLLMVPLAQVAPQLEEDTIEIFELPPKATRTEPPPTEPVKIEKTRPQPAPMRSERLTPARSEPIEAVVDAQPGDEALQPVDPVTPGGSTGETIGESTGPATGSVLQALSAPAPAYPGEAVRQGLMGTVELEILVGIDGRPLEVRVVRSSGHRVLDQAARRAVLTQWTFQPAFRNGQAVQALGRVPIEFKLAR